MPYSHLASPADLLEASHGRASLTNGIITEKIDSAMSKKPCVAAAPPAMKLRMRLQKALAIRGVQTKFTPYLNLRVGNTSLIVRCSYPDRARHCECHRWLGHQQREKAIKAMLQANCLRTQDG